MKKIKILPILPAAFVIFKSFLSFWSFLASLLRLFASSLSKKTSFSKMTLFEWNHRYFHKNFQTNNSWLIRVWKTKKKFFQQIVVLKKTNLIFLPLDNLNSHLGIFDRKSCMGIKKVLLHERWLYYPQCVPHLINIHIKQFFCFSQL